MLNMNDDITRARVLDWLKKRNRANHHSHHLLPDCSYNVISQLLLLLP